MKIQSLVLSGDTVEPVAISPEEMEKVKKAPVAEGKVRCWVQVRDLAGRMQVLRAVG